jgi:hypothetical protein
VRVASVDTGFVAAAPQRVFEVLADPTGYAQWWPGVRGGDDVLRLPGIGRATTRTGGVEPGVELTLRLQARTCAGRLQWYLEPYKEGTVVYGIVDLETPGRWGRRRRIAVRASIHRALVALKGKLE